MKQRIGLTATVMIWNLSMIAVAQSLPLQSRTYRMGSGYIQLATESGRTCYHGFSARGAIVASVSADPEHEGFYLVNGLNDFVLHQQDTETLLAGSLTQLVTYEADYSTSENISDVLRECLNSNEAFYNQVSGGRGSR